MPEDGLRRRASAGAKVPKRTIYVSQADRPTWDRLDRYVVEKDVTLASVIALAVRRFLDDEKAE